MAEHNVAVMPNWFGLTLMLVVAAVVMVVALARIAQIRSGSEVGGRLELMPRQPVAFDAPGTYVLYSDGPIGSTDLDGVTIGLTDPASDPVLRRTPAFKRNATPVARQIFEVAGPGEYLLVLEGLDAARGPFRTTLQFSRFATHRLIPWAVVAALAGTTMVALALFLASKWR